MHINTVYRAETDRFVNMQDRKKDAEKEYRKNLRENNHDDKKSARSKHYTTTVLLV